MSEAPDYLAAALAYASLGWKVFPIDPGSKRPLTPSGFRDATDDPEQVRRWWSAVPEAWVAVWCRGSGFVAVDADGEQGLALRASLEAQHGALPRACWQKTKNGEHVLLRDPSPGPAGWTRNRNEGGELRGNVGGAGVVDVKCNGYILVEPSGGRYRWLALDPGAIPEMPEAWQQLLRRGADAPKVPLVPAVGELADRAEQLRERLRAHLESPFGLGACGEASAKKRRRRLQAVLDGEPISGEEVRSGHMLVNELGIALARVWPGAGDDAAWEVLRACVLSTKCQNTPDQLEARARDGYAYAAQQTEPAPGLPLTDAVAEPDEENAEPLPGGPVMSLEDMACSEESLAAQAAQFSPEALAARRIAELLPDQAGDPDFLARVRAALERLLPEIDASARRARKLERPGFSKREARVRNRPSPSYLVDRLLPTEGVGMLAGEPKCGKSWDAMHLSVAVAHGSGTVFDHYAVQRAAGTFYWAAEDTEAAINIRTDAIAAGTGVPPDGEWIDRFYMQPAGAQLNILDDLDLAVLVAGVESASEEAQIQFGLVTLDPLSNLHDGEENERDSMAKVMARLHAVARTLGAFVLIIHHSAKSTEGKKGAKTIRGSGAIWGACDCTIVLNDVTGDGRSEFRASVECVVKAAASAGHFARTISVQDNAKGNAVRASWTWAERQAEKTEEDLESERRWAILSLLLQHGHAMSADNIRAKVKGNLAFISQLLKDLHRDGLVIQDMCGKQSRGWMLTEKGKQEARSAPDGGGGEAGTSEGGAPSAPQGSPHPALSSLLAEIPLA